MLDLQVVGKPRFFQMNVHFSFPDSRLCSARYRSMAAGQGVQYPGDVRNHGLQDYRDGDVRAHRRGWGGHGSGLLWVLWNYETRKVCSWFCKY